MEMENPPFEDVFPIQDGDFPASYVCLPEGNMDTPKVAMFQPVGPFFQVVAAPRGSQVRPGFRFAFDLEGLGAPRGLCLEIRQRCEPMAFRKV